MVTGKFEKGCIEKSEFSFDSSRCGNHGGWNGQRSEKPGIKLTTQRLEKNDESYCDIDMFEDGSDSNKHSEMFKKKL